MPLSSTVQTIILGTALLASVVSSARCAAASEPANDPVAVIVPTKHAVPMFGQPPEFWKEPKTSAGDALGASTHRIITIQKKPKICITSTIPLSIGKCLALNVFISVPIIPIPIIKSV